MKRKATIIKLISHLHLALLLGLFLVPRMGMATTISCGQTIYGAINTGGQTDSYIFSGTAGDVVVISAHHHGSSNLSVWADVYNPVGTYIGSAHEGNSGSLTLPTTGTYTILVHDNSYYYTGGYGVCLSFSKGNCGTAIACDQTIGNTISLGGQADSYIFSGTAGNVVVLSIRHNGSSNLGIRADIYDPTGTNLVGSVVEGSSGSITLPTTGTYTILVHDNSYYYTGAYGICLSYTKGFSGTAIACGQTINNSIGIAGQADSYSFIGTAGEVLSISAHHNGSSNLGARADIYDPTGTNIIGSALEGGSGNLILQMTGIYTILVHDNGYFYGGNYGVSLTVFGGCLSLPTVSVTPTNLVVAAGSSATFTATASGPTPLYYQWWFGSTQIAGATNATYNIAHVQTNNVGGYVVVVSNPGGAVASTPAAQLSISNVAILSTIPNTNILESVPWQYTPTVSGSGYTFGLSNAPSGMTVDTNSGSISWTPSEAQGPSTNGPITYAVYQSGSTVAWTNFTVVVLESNLPPVFLGTPSLQTVYATTTLNVSDAATDPDLPANTLTYAIVSGPTGVGINPNTGLLSWTPTTGQVGTSTIYVSATDYNPWAVNSQSLSVTNYFQVQVQGLTPPTNWTSQPVSLVIGGGNGFSFTASATGYPTPTFQWQFSTDNTTWVSINGATGATYSLASSGITNIGFYRLIAANSQGTNYSSVATLGFIKLNMLASVYLTGAIGSNYRIDAASQLAPTNWVTVTNLTIPSQPYIYVDYTSVTNKMQFYRAVPQ